MKEAVVNEGAAKSDDAKPEDNTKDFKKNKIILILQNVRTKQSPLL